MYKKILFVSLILFSIFSVNAGTTVLNSCAIPTGGWLSNEYYILNFTEIPIGIGNCFNLDGAIRTNITFDGENKIIINNDVNPSMFFLRAVSQINVVTVTSDKFTFKNIIIKGNPINAFIRTLPANPGTFNLINNVIENISIDSANYFYDGGSGVNSGFNGRITSFSNNIITNVTIKQINNAIIKASHFSSGGSPSRQVYIGFLNNQFIDTVFLSTSIDLIVEGGFFNNQGFSGNTFTNSVIGLSTIRPGMSFTNSILKGKIYIDSNNDNIGEGAISPFSNPFITLNLNNILYIQDFKEGQPFLGNNNIIIPINNEILGSGTVDASLTNNKLDNSLADYSFNNRNGLDVGFSGSIDCSILGNSFCFYDDNLYTGTTAGNYKPLIMTNSNNLINSISISKSGINNANFIANSVDVMWNNITISNSHFFIQSTIIPDTTNQLIALKSNNVKIFNNSFNTGGGVNNLFEIITLSATNPSSNNVYNNDFSSTLATQKDEIFTRVCDTNFYNNYIDSNYNISNSCSNNLNPTPLIGFKHTDNKIYYYNLGNFYVANTGCVDTNNTGFCDNSYTSGIVTDTNPLSSYPFDYTAHLFSPISIVDNTSFNINLLSPTSNQIITQTVNTEFVNFSFSEDSSFPDLTCDYVIDGIAVNGGTITNTVQNAVNSINVNGFTDGNHTYRVECGNSFNPITISNEINFFIDLPGGTPPTGGGNNNTGGGNNNTGGGNVSTGDFVDIQVIDFNSISNTNDNAVNFIQDIAGFVVNLGIPMAILIVVILSFLAVLRLLI